MRKIPARKHRGVKDPEKQQAARWDSIKDKINHPPRDPDEQAVPKRLLELKRLIERTKNGKKTPKKPSRLHKDKELIDTSKFKETEVILPGMRRAEKPVPVFKQMPGEENHQFVHRIQMKCQEVIHECTFEDKFNVKVERNAETGDIEKVSKIPKSDIAVIKFLKPRKTPQKSRSAKKREKRQQKLKEKMKTKKEKHVDDFAHFKDEVKFGETVHAPPQLNVLPRKVDKLENKNGRRDLLLQHLLPQKTQEQPAVLAKLATKNKKKPTLSAAEARRQEARRQDAVQAYRMMKLRKSSHAIMSQ